MHLTLLGGGEVTIHFRHVRNFQGVLYGNSERTEVILHAGPCSKKPCGVPGLKGSAFTHPNDQFNKAVGRKIALKRALESLPRERRTLIWEAYGRFTGAF
jgi:hypothetical protein